MKLIVAAMASAATLPVITNILLFIVLFPSLASISLSSLRAGKGLQGHNPGRSSLYAAQSDEVGKGWRVGFGNAQPGAEIIPERDAELGAGLDEAEEGVPAVAAGVAAGAAADFAPGDLTAGCRFRSRWCGAGFQVVRAPSAIRVCWRGAWQQGSLARGCRITAVGLEIPVELPDQGARPLLRRVVKLMHQPLGIDPA
jgi:hypothetical protein